MKFIIFILITLIPLFFSLTSPEQKQVSFLPLSHASFKGKSTTKQDVIVVYTPVDEIISVINPAPCDIIISPYYDLCSSYLGCDSCSLSPYCGWCTASNRCLPGSVSSVYCPSACQATWIYTNYDGICRGNIVTQTVSTSWVTPTIVSPVVSVETVTHSVDSSMYVQIGVQERVVIDENLNHVIETVPIYAEYKKEVPITTIETNYYNFDTTKQDQNSTSNNETHSDNNSSNENTTSNDNAATLHENSTADTDHNSTNSNVNSNSNDNDTSNSSANSNPNPVNPSVAVDDSGVNNASNITDSSTINSISNNSSSADAGSNVNPAPATTNESGDNSTSISSLPVANNGTDTSSTTAAAGSPSNSNSAKNNLNNGNLRTNSQEKKMVK